MLDAERRLAAAGFVATAVSYGPARMGFGLFLPEFRETFSLSSTSAGLIASASFAAFVAAVLLAGAMIARLGPRAPVLTACALAGTGMGLVAAAGTPAMLAAGVVLAGASPGLSWSPFNDAGNRLVTTEQQPWVLSSVSTGTTVGVALAGALALAASYSGLGWRMVWAIFALAGGAAFVVAARGLRGVGSVAPPSRPTHGLRDLLTDALAPICFVALSHGAISSIYISFAADWVTRSGEMEALSKSEVGAVIFISYGLCGLTGLATGALERQLRLVPLLRAVFLCLTLSLTLLALLPGSAPAVLVSAGLQGACVMIVSAVLAFWSLRLFPALPSLGFTAALLALAAGSALGPAAAGLAMDVVGTPPAFLATAGLSLATATALSARFVRARPAD